MNILYAKVQELKKLHKSQPATKHTRSPAPFSRGHRVCYR